MQNPITGINGLNLANCPHMYGPGKFRKKTLQWAIHFRAPPPPMGPKYFIFIFLLKTHSRIVTLFGHYLNDVST